MMTGDLPVRLTPSLKLISSSPPVMEPTETRTELRPIRLFLSAPRSLQSTAQDNLLLYREIDPYLVKAMEEGSTPAQKEISRPV